MPNIDPTGQIATISDGVYINSNAGYGVAGTVWPIGTPEFPVSNLANAQTIAVARRQRKLYLTGDFTLVAGLSNYIIIGNSEISIDPIASVRTYIDFNGQAIAYCIFKNCVIDDVAGGGSPNETEFDNCYINQINNPAKCVMKKCRVDAITNPAGTTRLFDCFSGTACAISMLGAAVSVDIYGFKGFMNLSNNNAAGQVDITGNGLSLTIAASCTAGTINIYGDVEITDNSAGTTVKNYTTGRGSKSKGLLAAGLTGTVTLATVTGPIRVDHMGFLVTTDIPAGANTLKFRFTPTGGVATDLCDVTDTASASAQQLFEVDGVKATALVKTTDLGIRAAGQALHMPIELGSGVVTAVFSVGPPATGAGTLFMRYTPISMAAVVA